MNLAGRRGGKGFRVGVDGDVDAEGGDPGGPADRLAEGGQLAVLLGFERHRGQLVAVGVHDLGEGDGFMEQPASRAPPVPA